MWSNYFKIAIRNLLKNKSFSFINIFGLAISMSVCLLILMLIKDANSYDSFHEDEEQIFRINTLALRKAGFSEEYASAPFPVGKALTDDYTMVENFAPLVRVPSREGKTTEKQLPFRGMFANEQFFEVFGFELENGNAATALLEPGSVVMTKETSERFFGDQNPVGEVIELMGIGDYKVSGVFEEFPGKTHLEFDLLVSFSSIAGIEQQEAMFPVLDNWLNYYMNYNYIKLKEGAEISTTQAALEEIAKSRYADLDLETRDAGYRFELHALTEITPGRALSNNMGRAMHKDLLRFLSFLGLIVIISASFNYTNLTIARALTRAREIGVRKVMGAKKVQVFIQFLSEAVLTTFLALIIGYHLMKLILPGFSQLSLAQEFDVVVQEDGTLFLWFLGFSLLVGLIAGIFPAFLLSKTKPIAALQRLENLKLFSKMGLRKGLLVLQFTLSLVFMIVVSFTWNQMQFAINYDYGFNRDYILNVRLQGNDYQKLAMDFEQLVQVEQVSGISHRMGTWEDGSVDVQKEEGTDPLIIRHYFVDHNYVDNLGIELLAGEQFPNNPTANREMFVIVNEELLKRMDLGTPLESVGKTLILDDTTQVAIHGVVKDFQYKPLAYNLEPMILRYDVNRLGFLNVKVNDANIPGTLASMERVWKKNDDVREFQYEFYEDTIEDTYSMQKDMTAMIGFIAFLAIVIAALGLLGMATYTVETRTKEIGIRKVIGASFGDLILLLSKGFLVILGISVVIALPLGWMMGTSLSQQFVHTPGITIGLFLIPILVMVVIGCLTIGSQTIRAALANPVEALRAE